MTLRKLAARALVAAAVAAAIGLGSFAFVTDAQAGPCRCPLIYAPVVCDNGKTYSNQCVADCHHAKNCVPAGIF